MFHSKRIYWKRNDEVEKVDSVIKVHAKFYLCFAFIVLLISMSYLSVHKLTAPFLLLFAQTSSTANKLLCKQKVMGCQEQQSIARVMRWRRYIQHLRI